MRIGMPQEILRSSCSFVDDYTLGLQFPACDWAGTGGLDHVNGRNVTSPSSPGVGFWHYDPIAWDDGTVSNARYFTGANDDVVIGSGMTTGRSSTSPVP